MIRDVTHGENWTMYLGDCREIMPTLTGIDAVVTDPPYGIAYNHGPNPQAKHAFSHRRNVSPVPMDDKRFDPSHLLGFETLVVFGANCFSHSMPERAAWLCWDKVTKNGLELRIGEFELAWARPLARPQMFRHLWSGAYRETERDCFVHPTQKPVELMKWCMECVKVEQNATVLDPYTGSGSTGVACIETGRKFIGIEIDRKYYEIACNRLRSATPCLFGNTMTPAPAKEDR